MKSVSLTRKLLVSEFWLLSFLWRALAVGDRERFCSCGSRLIIETRQTRQPRAEWRGNTQPMIYEAANHQTCHASAYGQFACLIDCSSCIIHTTGPSLTCPFLLIHMLNNWPVQISSSIVRRTHVQSLSRSTIQRFRVIQSWVPLLDSSSLPLLLQYVQLNSPRFPQDHQIPYLEMLCMDWHHFCLCHCAEFNHYAPAATVLRLWALPYKLPKPTSPTSEPLSLETHPLEVYSRLWRQDTVSISTREYSNQVI